MTINVLKSTEIEGLNYNFDMVRSSVARRLGMDIAGLVPSDRDVDGVVDMMWDATQKYDEAVTKERLCAWQASLFPGGHSGLYKVQLGDYRDASLGPMQVVSGALGKEKVHFEAPPAPCLESEMSRFLDWFNADDNMDLVLKAAVAHLWFLTLHPFDDGNGRIARALTDLLLAKSDGMTQRFYSMSAQIRADRKDYYTMLERTQKGSLDITRWVEWFLNCLLKSFYASEDVLKKVLYKHTFWRKFAHEVLNQRQLNTLWRLMGDFEGKLTTSKWAKLNKCSTDTALRDLQDLVEKGMLTRSESGGRSTAYELVRL
jgi:Fic family protein